MWVMDHLFPIEFESPPFPRSGSVDEPMLEAYAALSHLAAVTQRISLGPLVACAIYRHPSVLIKAATTLDVLSGGRSVLGIGAGWYEREARGLGIQFPAAAERYAILEDTLQFVHQAWSNDRRPYIGSVISAPEPIFSPQPVATPRPRILVGGSGERRTLRLVARYADACNLYFGAGPTEYAAERAAMAGKIDVLHRRCEEVGRDPAEIEITALGTVHLATGAQRQDQVIEVIEQVYTAGVDHAIVNLPNAYEPGVLERFGRIAEQLGVGV
jgi:alkanesulfonate monooxygenase SsuD/methylene tetrahydromethanopterin reductase-like flavin-dependent oxidoreductase (luciferase family)